jgi:phospholipid/cholesterol/gamma-HCH transport system substrate-binding protein
MNLLQIRRQLVPLIAMVVMLLMAIVVGLYITHNERLLFPWEDRYTVKVELPTGQALAPGQGQTATVAGVKVGDVAKVTLHDGRALVELSIDPDKLPAVYKDATLLVRPRTPLQDLTLDIDPGHPRAGKLTGDDVLPVDRATPTTNLDEILASLDTDTHDWAMALIGDLGRGVRNRGAALRAAFKASAPTLRSTRRVSEAIAARRHELARAITSLGRLTAAVAAQEKSVGRLVSGGNQAFSAVASEDRALREGLSRLPGTLSQADKALTEIVPLARNAGPAFDGLIPTAKRLPRTLDQLEPLLDDGPAALADLRAVSSEALPSARYIRSGVGNLAKAGPSLVDSFKNLRDLTNTLAYNPPGKEPVNESYLYWLAWFSHNGDWVFSGQDGNGPFWHGVAIASCSSYLSNPAFAALFGQVVQAAGVCPPIPGNP